ncbi:Uncharacterised protein [Mycobacteroides abscessus subsp. abscessus]|nr:Uncharacterised protein [Mycobacteroides abscessus subsp. abscessus]
MKNVSLHQSLMLLSTFPHTGNGHPKWGIPFGQESFAVPVSYTQLTATATTTAAASTAAPMAAYTDQARCTTESVNLFEAPSSGIY